VDLFRHGDEIEGGALLDCILSGDFNDLAAAIARSEPSTTCARRRSSTFPPMCSGAGADIGGRQVRHGGQTIGVEPIMESYGSIDKAAADAEAERWIRGAEAVVEPSRDEIPSLGAPGPCLRESAGR